MPPSVTSFVNIFQNKLEAPVRQHLKNVYATVTMTCVAASAGAFVEIYTNFIKAGFFTFILRLGLMLMVDMTPDNGKNTSLRLGYLLGSGVLSGMELGLGRVIMLDPSILVTALLGTTVLFVLFSIAAMLAERGCWLFLGGPLMFLQTTLIILSLGTIYMQATILYLACFFLYYVLMCGFVLYHTQFIIEERQLGSEDYVSHALDIFADFIDIFGMILNLLTDEEED